MVFGVFRQNWKKFAIFCGLYFVLLFIILFFYGVNDYLIQQKDKEVKEILDQITYTEETAKQEQEQLLSFIQNEKLSDRSAGLLYKALTQLTYMSGDDKEYNELMSRAIFYLSKSGQDNDLANLYTRYIGILYSNGAYDSCRQLFEDLARKIDIKECTSEVKISYELGFADVDEMVENLDDAKIHLDYAKEMLNTTDTYSLIGVDHAKLDMLEARLAIVKEDYTTAKQIMSDYTEDYTCGLQADNMFMICDYKIPYYEIITKLLLIEGNDQEALPYIEKYIAYCDQYNFRLMKLNFLQFVSSNLTDDIDLKEKNYYVTMCDAVTAQTIDDFAQQYGEYLLVDVFDSISELEYEQTETKEVYNRLINIYILVFVFCFTIIFMKNLIIEMRVDGLTRIRNRRSFEEAREKLYKKKIQYYCMIIDIDDFKKINDKYGHQMGDDVLVHIAKILREFENEHIRCYRYGGEEFCVIFRSNSKIIVHDLAEEIRLEIQNKISKDEMIVTVSGGVAYSSDGTNVFIRADHHLYEAKAAGKNQIIFD